MAADRYRGWAAEMAGPEDRDALHACAAREEEIATRIERLDPDAAVVQRALRDELPDLESITRSVFDRPLTEQLRVQAMGERLGAATWTAFAERERDAARRAVLLGCAALEVASAETLERILAARA